jgi:hypothetical protein
MNESLRGERYLWKAIEEAINGRVRHIKPDDGR